MDSKTREYFPGAGLPFITTAADSDFAQINFFDVKRESYIDGLTTGMHAFYRLMFAVESGSLKNFKGETEQDFDEMFKSAVSEAFSASNNEDEGEFTRRGAAIGFLYSVGKSLRDYAMGRAWRDTMLDEVHDANVYELSVYESSLKKNADLVQAVARPATEVQLPAKASTKSKSRVKAEVSA